MTKESWFLIVAGIGLTPIALAYGAAPSVSMPMLYGVEVNDVSTTHILRAVMGLYLMMALFWLAGARNALFTLPALYSVVVFMLGLAAGRALSLILDGMPSPMLVVYLLLEIGFGVIGTMLIRGYSARPAD
ncbi:DUF4345 domain-containing protein [Halioglobus maricola]|uniref:DUF4345 domain-containing protein n=1 Tax=Halioglobus maricola TaxID=2601894 RepID=A0A5P9NF10_9GAMM|nr:DUF4345 domain-containing protein [Halioglobus maricola]QFU74340.1 DUF4345 domain-containing protein [Halioglobus maricola]